MLYVDMLFVKVWNKNTIPIFILEYKKLMFHKQRKDGWLQVCFHRPCMFVIVIL